MENLQVKIPMCHQEQLSTIFGSSAIPAEVSLMSSYADETKKDERIFGRIAEEKQAAVLTHPWFLNSVQLTPPYSPGNNSFYPCLAGIEAKNCPAVKISETDEEHFLSVEKSESTAHLGALAISDSFPSPSTPSGAATVSESNTHLSISVSQFSALDLLSDTAVASLSSRGPPPPCCREHAKEHCDAAERDSESSLITPECVGSFTVEEGIEIPSWGVGMTGKELEIRIKMLNVQRVYREKQKEVLELRKLTRRCRRKSHEKIAAVCKRENYAFDERWRWSSGSSEVTNSEGKEQGLEEQTEKFCSELPPVSLSRFQISDHITDNNLELEDLEEDKDSAAVSSLTEFSQELSGERESQTEQCPNQEKSHIAAFENVDSSTRDGITTSFTESPKLFPQDLVTGLRLILLEGGLFYPGTLEVLDEEALLYGVLVDGQRVSRPHVLCQEELLISAMKEISLKNPVVGGRVCAFWSGQLRALYPGTLSECNCSFRNKSGEQLVTISFDDGDSGQIPQNDVRVLPRNFPITKIESPVLPSFITRKRQNRMSTNDQLSTEVKVFRRNSLSKKPNKSTHHKEVSVVKEFWEWEGVAELDSKRRVPIYKAIRKGDTVVRVGDLVQLRSDARFGGSRSPTTGNNVYVGFVRKLWETRNKVKRVRVAWCYRSNEVEQTASVKKLQWKERAVFDSSHTDDNSVETISCRCELVSWTEFMKKQTESNELDSVLYYLAGTYDPVNKRIKMEADMVGH